MNGRCVFPNLKTGSAKFLRLSNVDKIVLGLYLRLTEASCFVKLRFLVSSSF